MYLKCLVKPEISTFHDVGFQIELLLGPSMPLKQHTSHLTQSVKEDERSLIGGQGGVMTITDQHNKAEVEV